MILLLMTIIMTRRCVFVKSTKTPSLNRKHLSRDALFCKKKTHGFCSYAINKYYLKRHNIYKYSSRLEIAYFEYF